MLKNAIRNNISRGSLRLISIKSASSSSLEARWSLSIIILFFKLFHHDFYIKYIMNKNKQVKVNNGDILYEMNKIVQNKFDKKKYNFNKNNTHETHSNSSSSSLSKHLFKNQNTYRKNPFQNFQMQISQADREIRYAIEIRFSNSKMNKQYKLDNDNLSNRQSSHSSEFQQFKYLKDTKFYNLRDQNKKYKKIKQFKFVSLKKLNGKDQLIKQSPSPENNSKQYRIRSKQDRILNFMKRNESNHKSSNIKNKNQNKKYKFLTISTNQEELEFKSTGSDSPYLHKHKFKSKILNKKINITKIQKKHLDPLQYVNSKSQLNLISISKSKILQKNLIIRPLVYQISNSKNIQENKSQLPK